MNIRQFMGIALLTLTCFGSVEAQALREPSTPEEWRRVNQALEERGIRAAAALYGKYVQEEFVAPNGVAGNVRGLALQSDIIVLCRVLSSLSTIAADGKGITTEYRVAVDRAFRGPTELKQGDIVDVSLPGGYVEFPDGSSAKGWTRGLRLMESGHTYLLFLTPARDAAPEEVAPGVGPLGRYKLTMGGQGAYQMDNTSAGAEIVAMGNSDTPVAHELFTLKTPEAAMVRVQQAVDSLSKTDAQKKVP